MRTVALSLIAMIALEAAACRSEPEISAAAEDRAVEVQLGRAEGVELAAPFESGGVLRSRYTAVIASRVMAPIAEVHVRPGDRVRRGARLVTLDARESTANSTRANAALASATEALRSAEAESRAADAQLRLAQATYARIATLHDKRSATAQELDQAVAALSAAEAQLASARARAASLVAAREAADAAREAATVGVSYSTLTAPFNGVVIERNADPGSMATPGGSLLAIEDPTVYRLEVQVDESRAASVTEGQAVTYRLDTMPGDAWHAARVTEIGRIDPASHSFLVKLDVLETGGARSGAFGRVRFPGKPRRAIAVPASAVVRRGQLRVVFIVDSEGRARLRPISTGIETTDRVEVHAGLAPDQTIVSNPPAGLTDGTRVVQP